MPDPDSRLRPATRWAREQLDAMLPKSRADLEAAIPDGFYVALSGRPPNVAAWLCDLNNPGAHSVASVYHQPSQWAAVYAVLVEGADRAGG